MFACAFLPGTAFAQSLTIQGKVLDGSNNPVNGSATQFRVQVLSPDTQRCVLFDETHTVDLTNTNGLFTINLNDSTGTLNAPNTYTLEQALSNRAAFSVNSSYCGSGTGTLTYTPGASDNRKVVIQFRDPGTMSSFETIPEMDLNPVAWSMESRTVGGFAANSLLRVVAGGTPGTAPTLTTADVAELQSVIAGTSTKYLARDIAGGASIPSYAGNPASPSAGSLWFDATGSGALKFKDASGTIQTLGAGGAGTITSVTGNNGLSASTTSGAVTIGMQAITPTSPAGDYGSASSVPVIRVDAYGRVTQAGSASITGTLPTGTAGEFLKYSAGAWGSAAVRMSDIKNATGAAALFGSTTCAASETFYWDSGTDQFKCQSIALGAPAAAVAATYTKVTVAADGRVNGGSATIGNSDIADLAWGKLTSVPSLVTNGGSASSLVANNTGSKPAGQIAGRIYVDVSNQKISYDDGTAWVDVSGSASATPTVSVSAPLTSTSGTVGISQANGSQNGFLSSSDWTSFTGKLSGALANSHLFVGNGSGQATDVAVSGDVSLANTGKFTVTGIRDQAISGSGTSLGQVLRYSAANIWAPEFLTMKDLRSTVTGTQALTSSCTAGKTMYWDSGTDSLGCQDISISASTQISGVLPIANGGTGTNSAGQNLVFAGPSSGAGAPAFRALAAGDLPAEAKLWTELSGNIYRNGNVGIGTSVPAKPLSVVAASAMQASFQSTGANNAGIFIDNAAGGLLSILQLQDAGVTKWQLGKGADNSFFLYDFANSKSVLSSSAGQLILQPSSGNVGVGTSSPLMKFAVQGTTGYPATTGTTPIGIARFEGTLNNNILDLGKADAAPWGMWLQATNRTDLSQAYPIILNPNAGSVGIGTTSPKETLQVGSGGHGFHTGGNLVHLFNGYYSPSNSRFEYGGYTGGSKYSAKIDFSPSTGILQIANTSATGAAGDAATYDGGGLTLLSGGNIGIGTTNPTQKLDVNGAIKATSFIGPVTASSAGNSAGYTINSDSDSAGSDGGVNIQVRGSTKLAVTDGGRVAVGGVATPVSLLANTSTNTNDQAGTGSSADSLSWLTNAAGYVASFVNSSSATNANGILVKTTGTASTNRILNLNANGTDVVTVTGDGRMGIGSTAPTTALDTVGAIAVHDSGVAADNGYNGALRITRGATSGQQINFVRSATNTASLGYKPGAGSVLGFGLGNATDASFSPINLNIDFGTSNVGIGTTSPTAKLHVRGAGEAGAMVRITDSTSGGDYTLTASAAGTANLFGIGDAAASAYRLVINSAGKVGINTTNPRTSLDVIGGIRAVPGAPSNDAANAGYSFGANGDTGLFMVNNTGAADGDLAFYSNAQQKITMLSGGNLGIGTATPTSRLHVLETAPAAAFATQSNIAPVLTADTSSNYYAAYNLVTANSSFNFNNGMYGALNRTVVSPGNTGTIATVVGGQSDVILNQTATSATTASAYGSFNSLTANSGATTSGGYAAGFIVGNSGAGTLVDAAGLRVLPPTNTGTGSIGTYYGLHISTPTAAGTNYAIYSQGGTNYFGGNVGIGTTTPGSQLTVVNNTPANAAITLRGNSATTWPAASLAFTDTGASGRNFTIGSRNTVGFSISDETAAAIRLVIASNGNVGLGTHVPGSILHLYNNAPYVTFDEADTGQKFFHGVDGSLMFMRAGSIGTANIFTLSTAGNMAISGSLTQNSDIRLKTGIEEVQNSLDKLAKIRGVTYYWKDEARDRSQQLGLIAQDVEAVFPQAVKTDKAGFKSVAYQNLVGPIINAVNELRARLFGLDERVSTMERELASLKADKAKLQDKVKDLETKEAATRAWICSQKNKPAFCH